MVHWLPRDDRRPLILRGARQVGKSTAVRMLAEEQNLDLFEVNLEKHAPCPWLNIWRYLRVACND
jgi:hypothetical protein